MKSELKGAFTLLEVIISIMLLSLVLMALYRSADILRQSNKNLFKHLQHSSDIIKGANTLYMDLLESDGHITILDRKKFHRLIIENTKHSLYGLYKAQITWLIYKDNNTLLRIEGSEYKLPLRDNKNVAIDKVSDNIELFNIYRNKKKSKVLVVLKSSNHEVISFIVQNLEVKAMKNYPTKVPIVGGVQSTKRDKKSDMLK
jgi:prepilin-type N-terminal cleavage/methylation domain-containing protein